MMLLSELSIFYVKKKGRKVRERVAEIFCSFPLCLHFLWAAFLVLLNQTQPNLGRKLGV